MYFSRRRYTRIALGAWLGLLAAAAGFNLAVDPYCAYRIAPGWFDEYKPAYHRAETKAELVLARRPTTLVLGTSRSMVFDPRWSEFAGENAFNLGIPSASLPEVAAALKFAVKNAPVERVFLCVCFSQFGSPTKLAPFERSKFSPNHSPWNYHLQNVLSWDALDDSFRTLRDFARNRPSSYTPLGDVRDGRFPLNGPHRKRFVDTTKQYEEIYGVYSPSPKALDALRWIVRLCRERRIELTVVTSPVHALHLETAAAKGLWDDYERWLVEAARIVDEESGGKTHLWDFAGYNRYTTEPAPLAEDSPAATYHQESSHFSAALARKVLERVYDEPGADASFGVELTRDNAADRVARLRLERAAWLSSRPAALALLGEAFPERLADAPAARDAILK